MARRDRRRPRPPGETTLKEIGGGLRWWAVLAAIGAGALAIRLLHLAALSDTPLFAVLLGDSREYDRWAQEIAHGAWIGTGVFYQAPLYPYLLAVAYSLAGHDVMVVRVLQSALGALSCVLLGLSGRQFFGPAPGLIAAALLAIYPPAIFFDALIQKSSVDLVLVTLLLVWLGALVTRPEWRWLVPMGLTLGAFSLNRENAGILYPVLAVWIWMHFRHLSRRTRAAWIGVLTASIAAVLLPVGARNYAAGGEFVLTTSQLGPNFYIGNHANAGGSYESLLQDRGDAAYERTDATRLAEQAEGRRLTAREVSRYWLSRAWEDIRANPLRWLRLMWRKILLTVNAQEALDTESIEAHAAYSPLLRALRWLDFGVVLPLGVLGAWLTRPSWRRLTVLYAMFVALAAAVAAFYVLARYRLPLVPIVLVFAGAGLWVAWRAARSTLLRASRASSRDGFWRAEDDRRAETRRALRTALLLAAATAVVANLPLPLSSHDDTGLNIASALVRSDRAAEAIPLLEQAIAASPDHAVAHYELGWALIKAGDRRRAIEPLRTAVRLRPEHAEARIALAGLLLEAGDPSGALEQAGEAVRLRPNNFAMRVNLANVLFGLKRTDAAIAHYEHALRIVPDSVPEAISVLSLLAEAYREAGRRPEAMATLEKAVALAQAAKLADVTRQLEQTIRIWRSK